MPFLKRKTWGYDCIRIIYLSYYYLPHVGGGTWSTYHLSLQLSKRGHFVQLIVPNIKHKLSVPREYSLSMQKRNLSKVHRTPVLLIPRKLGPLLSGIFVFCSGLRFGKGVDIIVSQYHPHHLLSVIAVLLGRILKVPVVLRADDVYREMGIEHLGLINRLIKVMNAFNEYFIRYADILLVVCSEAKEILRSRLRVGSQNYRIGLSYNGVDLSEFDNTPSKFDTREALDIGLDDKVLLFIGRYSGEEYGIQVLLRALPAIVKRKPNTLLILVGDELTPRQQSLYDSLGVHRNTRTYGPKPHEEIIKFIATADLCIGPLMPTLAIPLKVLDYMACGKPVLTGVKSISKDLALNDSNCLIVPPDSKTVAGMVTKLLQDEDYARRLGANARKIATNFSWNKIATDLERLLVMVIVERRSRR